MSHPCKVCSFPVFHNILTRTVARRQTRVIADNLVRVMAWYDNEWGFSHRMLDVAVAMGLVIND